MADKAEKGLSGLELLRQPATLALARYLNDLHSVLGFEAYLWRMIVKTDYNHGDPTKFPKPGDPPPPESAVAQIDIHSAVLGEMIFCRGVKYLADLMTLIYEKYPKKLPSNKQTTYRFCIEHHIAGDLISALAEETVTELTHQSLDALAKYFKENLDLVLFTKGTHLANAALCVDIRNVTTHNRGIVNRFFIRRNPRFADDLGKRVVSANRTDGKCSVRRGTAPGSSTFEPSRSLGWRLSSPSSRNRQTYRHRTAPLSLGHGTGVISTPLECSSARDINSENAAVTPGNWPCVRRYWPINELT